MKKGIKELYSLWGVDLEVQIWHWSFMEETTEMIDRLMNADLFYFAGVHKIPQGLNHAMRNGPLLHLLLERIQYNQCAFFGVCGGAMMAGKNNPYGLPGLDIFDGITVQYDMNVGASIDYLVATNAEAQIMQMTTGCALAFVMDAKVLRGTSFACIKNHAGWWPVAQRNTREVQSIIDMKKNDWTSYHDEDGQWWFNLQGIILRSPGSDELLQLWLPLS